MHTGSIHNVNTVFVHHHIQPFRQGVYVILVERQRLDLEELLQVNFKCLLGIKMLPLQLTLKGAEELVV